MEIIIVGILAGTFCTISFIPQIIKIYRTKNAKDLSITTFLVFSLGVSLWLTYGILIKEAPIIIANTATLLLVMVILIMKLKYR